MDTVTKFFKEENDYLYRRGEKKGELIGELVGRKEGVIKGEMKKSLVVVENLIMKLGLSDEQAALIAEVSVDFVAEVRLGINKK